MGKHFFSLNLSDFFSFSIIQNGVEYIYSGVLKHIEDTVDYWKTYTRSETKEAVHDIWFNAKPDLQEFLDNIE